MNRSLIPAVIWFLTACSPGGEPNQQAPERADTSKPASIASARHSCEHVTNKSADVGISDYQACLGQKANLSRPANRKLCDLSKGTMSASGTCILAE